MEHIPPLFLQLQAHEFAGCNIFRMQLPINEKVVDELKILTPVFNLMIYSKFQTSSK